MLANLDIEADVLGALMLSSAQGDPLAPQLAGALGDSALSSDAHRCVYAALQTLSKAGQPHDALAVAAALRDSGEIDRAGGMGALMGMQAECSSLVNLDARVRYLQELARRRALVALCQETVSQVQHGESAEVIAGLSRGLDQLLASGAADAESFAAVMDRTEQHVDELQRARKAGLDIGVPFGIPTLDALTGGMRPGELIGIAARTSIGKTALANQVAVHAAMRGHAGLIITLEEPVEGVGLRTIANRGSLNLLTMRSGQVNADCVADTIRDHGLRDLPLWVDNRTQDLGQIMARIAQYARRHAIRFAVVDHIALVRVPAGGGKKRYEQIGEVTRGLKLLASQLGIAIVAVIQVGRESEKENRRPMLSDLRESGNIEQDLNSCVALHPTGDPDEHGRVPVEIGLLKNRYGPRNWLDKPFVFNGALQQLHEITDRESA